MAIDTKKIGEAPNGELLLGSIAGTEQLPLSGSKFIILDTLREWFAGIFTNKSTLDKLAESNGELTYNNVPLSKSGAKIIDKGSQASAVVFALGSDSRQKVVATGTTLSINFSDLPTDFSTTSVIDVTATGNTVTVTFDASIPTTAWVDGDVLASIADGKTYCLSVTTNGNTKAALLITYIKKGI